HVPVPRSSPTRWRRPTVPAPLVENLTSARFVGLRPCPTWTLTAEIRQPAPAGALQLGNFREPRTFCPSRSLASQLLYIDRVSHANAISSSRPASRDSPSGHPRRADRPRVALRLQHAATRPPVVRRGRVCWTSRPGRTGGRPTSGSHPSLR